MFIRPGCFDYSENDDLQTLGAKLHTATNINRKILDDLTSRKEEHIIHGFSYSLHINPNDINDFISVETRAHSRKILSLLDSWKYKGEPLDESEDFFHDKIRYKIRTFHDIERLNEELAEVGAKYVRLLADTPETRLSLCHFLANMRRINDAASELLTLTSDENDAINNSEDIQKALTQTNDSYGWLHKTIPDVEVILDVKKKGKYSDEQRKQLLAAELTLAKAACERRAKSSSIQSITTSRPSTSSKLSTYSLCSGERPPSVPCLPSGVPSIVTIKPKEEEVISSDIDLTINENNVEEIMGDMIYDKLLNIDEITNINVTSYEVLKRMASRIYNCATEKPSLMEACSDLSIVLMEKVRSSSFIHIIPSDEHKGGCYRWSNHVTFSETETIGPFSCLDGCFYFALYALKEGLDLDHFKCTGRELVLIQCCIVKGTFIKVLREQSVPNSYHVVFFPLSDKDKHGQQLSFGYFKNKKQCLEEAIRLNRFQSVLLNKCENEFNMWNTKKTSTINKSECIQEGIKPQSLRLNNIKFIAALYKRRIIRTCMIHACICTLLKFNFAIEMESQDIIPDDDFVMDDDHIETVYMLFILVGMEIDTHQNRNYMDVYIRKMASLCTDKSISKSSRQKLKKLIRLRDDKWKSWEKEVTGGSKIGSIRGSFVTCAESLQKFLSFTK